MGFYNASQQDSTAVGSSWVCTNLREATQCHPGGSQTAAVHVQQSAVCNVSRFRRRLSLGATLSKTSPGDAPPRQVRRFHARNHFWPCCNTRLPVKKQRVAVALCARYRRGALPFVPFRKQLILEHHAYQAWCMGQTEFTAETKRWTPLTLPLLNPPRGRVSDVVKCFRGEGRERPLEYSTRDMCQSLPLPSPLWLINPTAAMNFTVFWSTARIEESKADPATPLLQVEVKSAIVLCRPRFPRVTTIIEAASW